MCKCKCSKFYENKKVIVFIEKPLDLNNYYVNRDIEILREDGVIVVNSYYDLEKEMKKWLDQHL